MDEDAGLLSQLGGFALDQFLGDFTGDKGIKASGLSALGLGSGSRGVDASQIYSDRFADDDEEPSGSISRKVPKKSKGKGGQGNGKGAASSDDAEDWEDEVDRELDEEDRLLVGTSTTPYGGALTMTGMMNTHTRLRGEDDDFDEDEDDEGGAGNSDSMQFDPSQQQGGFNGLALPSSAPRASTSIFHGLGGREVVQVKQEEPDEDDEELAQQQALFQQSFARMQAQQMPDEQGLNLQPAPPLLDVATLYPSFGPNKILDFTELFTPRPRKRPRIDPDAALYPLPDAANYSTVPSTRDFRPHIAYDRSTLLAQYLLDALAQKEQEDSEDQAEQGDAGFDKLVETANEAGWRLSTDNFDEKHRITYDDWPDDVHWDGSRRQNGRTPLTNGYAHDGERINGTDDKKPLIAEDRTFGFRNPEVESGEWTKGVIWSERAPFKDFTKLQLNLNDPSGPGALASKELPLDKRRIIAMRARQRNDPFNLSNDKLYEVAREQKKRVRQTFGHLEVQHAYPAMKLQFPWYKTQLSKTELRSFHRPPIQFPTNIPLSFSKVRSFKKKKDKSGRKLKKDTIGAEAFRTMGDLSLRDSGNFVLWEYSEENPPIISNIGMGSILVNYYRKTDASDSYVPKAELGEPFLLDPSDESPFLRFGQVEPGQMIPALYTNLVRAPLFKHQPYDTDFLVVKTTVNGESKFYLREIKHIYVIGQTYPLTDVPGPQSRKLTSTAKHRLQSIAYKLVSKHPRKRVKIGKLLKYFPDQTEMQMRQRLKEFMEYNRAGDDQGFWKIKAGKMPEEDELFKLIGPENIVLSESTAVGQRNLLDLGFSATGDEDKGKDTEESTLDIRQQLAPWFMTKNFMNATQNKAMLKLHGEGDPSSRGEAFSFLRVSMKDIFLRAGEKMEDRLAEIEARPKSAHRYNVAEQQAIYREEVTRIWRAQYEALSSPYEPMITEEDELRWRQEEARLEPVGGATPAMTPFTPAGNGDGSMSPGGMFGDRDSRSLSPGTMEENMNKGGPPKVLRIRRLVNGVWKSEVVRDQAVIKGYLRQRQLVEAEDEQEPESLQLTGDVERDKVIKKKLAEQLEKLRKNQERRLQRKNAKMGVTGDVFLPGGKKVKNETTRRCGNCGQIGHMKTNRKCPKWAEFNAANNQQPGANAPSGPANPFAVGLPGLSGMNAGSPSE